jgi:hypothetical protein
MRRAKPVPVSADDDRHERGEPPVENPNIVTRFALLAGNTPSVLNRLNSRVVAALVERRRLKEKHV